LIGTDVTGKVALGNATGLTLNFSGTLNIIGGTTASARNVISGNGNGIELLSGDQTFVQGNYIGTDITGKVGLGNTGYGIYVSSNGNGIGGTTVSEGNLISANGADGIRIADGAKDNYISCNSIGFDAGGVGALGNGGAGILIENGNDTIIGGAAGAANAIAFNQLSGVSVLKGAGNLITCNQITSNQGLGIDLGTAGSTANDQDDADSGPNNLQNFPVLSRATRLSNGATWCPEL
jgi:titin